MPLVLTLAVFFIFFFRTALVEVVGIGSAASKECWRRCMVSSLNKLSSSIQTWQKYKQKTLEMESYSQDESRSWVKSSSYASQQFQKTTLLTFPSFFSPYPPPFHGVNELTGESSTSFSSFCPGLDLEVQLRIPGPGPASEFLLSSSFQECYLNFLLELEGISTVFRMHIHRETIDISLGSGNSVG